MWWTVFKTVFLIALHAAAAFAYTGNPVSLLIGTFLLFYWMSKIADARPARDRRAPGIRDRMK